MGEYLDSLHEAHKARQNRLKRAALRAVTEALNSVMEPEPELLPEPPPDGDAPVVRRLTAFDTILNEICTYYNVRKLDVLSQRRMDNVVHARHMLAYMLHRMTSFTNGQIAHNMQKDMSSISYAINKIINHIQSHQSDIDELENRIGKLLAQRKMLVIA